MSNPVDIEDAKALKRWATAQYTRRHRQLAREYQALVQVMGRPGEVLRSDARL